MDLDKIAYNAVVEEIKDRVRQAQYKAMKLVNKELIKLYWFIGQTIVSKQAALGWGKSVVDELAKDLQSAFPGTQGFSSRNLWRMRSLYQSYHANEKLPPLVAEIGWSHNIVIMEKCKDDLEREFYMKMARKYGWTKNILIHQIEGNTYGALAE